MDRLREGRLAGWEVGASALAAHSSLMRRHAAVGALMAAGSEWQAKLGPFSPREFGFWVPTRTLTEMALFTSSTFTMLGALGRLHSTV